MSLLLGQLVYTSFVEVGYKLIVSANVPKEIQQAFIQQIVHQHWDSFDPPSSGYRAAYLYQLTLEHNLFGWLYNDGLDDLGRSHVPYFVCDYYCELLHAVQLENIFTCLSRGPVALIDRQNFPPSLENMVLADLWSYQSARIGVEIPLDIRDRNHVELKHKELLKLFIALNEPPMISKSVETASSQEQKKPQSTKIELNDVAAVSEAEASALIETQPSAATVYTNQSSKVGLLNNNNTNLISINRDSKLFFLTGTVTGILILIGALYSRAQGQYSQQLKTITAFTQERNYKECISVAKTIDQSSIFYTKAQVLLKQCEVAINWQNAQVQSRRADSDMVWSLALSPERQTFVSSGSDNKIRIWNLGSRKLLQTLSGHSDIVWSVTLSPDGQTLVSGSNDNKIKIWNLGSGKLRQTLFGHSGAVRAIALSLDGQTLVSSGSDNKIKIWNLGSGELLQTLSGHSDIVLSVALSPDGQTLVSGSSDNKIKIWNLGSGKLRQTLFGHSGAVRAVTLSSDGQTLVSGSSDNKIKIWNLGRGKLLRTLSGHTDRVISVALSADGQTLASGSVDKTVNIWNLSSGKLLHSF